MSTRAVGSTDLTACVGAGQQRRRSRAARLQLFRQFQVAGWFGSFQISQTWIWFFQRLTAARTKSK